MSKEDKKKISTSDKSYAFAYSEPFTSFLLRMLELNLGRKPTIAEQREMFRHFGIH